MEYLRGSLKNQKGFTLIEVVVAIVIITALVSTFAPLIVSSVNRIRWAGKRTQTLYTIRGKMEKNMALVSGSSHQVTISGHNASGEKTTWNVTGKLISIHERSEEEKLDELLVSFVVPRE